MDRYRNRNRAPRETCFSPRTERERPLLLERAQRILELPMDYVPNPQFEAWRRDKLTESRVLGPMPAPSQAENGGGEAADSEPPGKVARPSGLAPYVASLYDVPLLTRAQEAHLFRKLNYLKYKTDGLRARLNPSRPQRTLLARIETLCQEIVATRNQIITANLRLVVSIAKRYLGPAQSFFELVSDGNLSLMRAVERFDYSLGNRFSTYATWAIINNFTRTMQESLSYRDQFRTDSFQFIAATAEVPGKYRELQAAQVRRETALNGILRRLNDREREIIVCRYGLRRGDKPQTLQQVGEVMGVSKERIRQIEARALSKLRQAAPPEALPRAAGKRRLLTSIIAPLPVLRQQFEVGLGMAQAGQAAGASGPSWT